MRRKVLASALSVLLVTASVPVPAIAEGIDDVQPVAIEQAAAPEEAADEAADGEQVPADNATEPAADEATASDAGEAVVDEAAETENAIAAEEPAAEATDEAEGADAEAATVADVADTAAATPATQAAGDPYETEAPAYDAAKLAGIYGSVHYRVGDGAKNSTSIVNANNIAYIGKPMKDNETGGWKIVVTLKSDLTAADLGLRSWEVGGNDPKQLYVADTSDLSIQFKTDSATDGTWGVSSTAGAEITFTSEQPKPQNPGTINITDVISTLGTINYTLKTADGGTYDARTEIATDANMANLGSTYWNGSAWAADVTLQAFDTPEAYGIEVPAFFAGDYQLDAEASKLTVTFVYQDGAWTCPYENIARLVFTEVTAPTVDDIAGMWGVAYYTLRNADGSEGYTVTTQLKADALSVGTPYLDNGAWKVDITVDALTSPEDYDIMVPGWHDEEYKLNAGDSKLTFTMTRNVDGTWSADPLDTATLVFDPVVAPAFDINNELNVYGTVRYQLNKADDTTYEDNTHLVSADNIASVGIPYQTEDGCWAVDVTLKDTATPDDYEVPNWALGDGAWKLDTNASDLTLTFRTLSPEGTTWYCSGADRANLVFAEQADAPDEKPGTGDGTEKPGTGTGTEQPGDDTKAPVTDDAQDKGNASDNQAKDTQEAAADEDTLTQTGDPADGLAVIAAGGVLAVVAGIELKRRSAGERL